MQKRIIISLTLLFVIVSLSCFSQDGLTFRVAVNYSMFQSEPGSTNSIVDPFAELLQQVDGTRDFKNDIAYGFEAEILKPLTEKLSIGVEFENSKYSGYNDNPIYYNYFTSPFYLWPTYNQQPLLFETNVLSILANIRYFFMPENTFSPYIKTFGGISYISTDLRFKNPEDQTNLYDPLYSRGTKLSEGEGWDKSSQPALNVGAGIGFKYFIMNNAWIYTDASISYINTDIINGIPNFSYNETSGISEHDARASLTAQFSVGIAYSLGSISPSKKGKSKGGKSSSGKADSNFPFYRRK